VCAHACARINPRLGPIKCPTPRVSRFTPNRKDGSRRSAPKKAVRWISLFVKVCSLLRYRVPRCRKDERDLRQSARDAALIVALSCSTSERDALRKTPTLDARARLPRNTIRSLRATRSVDSKGSRETIASQLVRTKVAAAPRAERLVSGSGSRGSPLVRCGAREEKEREVRIRQRGAGEYSLPLFREILRNRARSGARVGPSTLYRFA